MNNISPKELENIDKLLLKGFSLLRTREFDKAISIGNKILTEKTLQLNLTQKFSARLIRSIVLESLRKYDQVNEEIKICDKILDKMANKEKENIIVKEGEGRLLSIKGAVQTYHGDLEGALVSYHQSLKQFETLSNKKSMNYQLGAIGWIKRAQCKLDQALVYFQSQLKLTKEIADERRIASSMFNIAFIYFYKGDLHLAMNYAQECFTLYEKLNNKRGIARAYSIFGSIYRGKGELDKSLEYYHRVLTIYNDLGIQKGVRHEYCYALRNIGWIHYYKNNIKKSIDYLKEAVEAHKSLCFMNKTLFDYDLIVYNLLLIEFSIEIDDFNQIEVSMEEITKFALKWHWTDFFKKLGKAFILKSKQRAKYRFQAQQLFEEILEVRFDFLVEFMIQVNLCDLLLEELKYSGEEEILEEIQAILNKISEFATKQRSITTLVDLYSLQAKLALVEGKAELSKSLLIKALSIAKNKGLELLVKKLTSQQNQLVHQLEEWKALFINNTQLQERIEALNLKDSVSKSINEVLEKKFIPGISEEKVTVHKEKKSCLVCKGEVERYNIYICPKCDTIYCENCAHALTNLENACWACSTPFDSLKPIIPVDEVTNLEIVENSKKKNQKKNKDSDLSINR